LQVFCDVAAGDVDALDGVWDGEAFVDGDAVGDAVAGVEDEAGGAAGGVEGEDGLDGGVEGGDVEGFEEDLGGGFAVAAGVEGGFGKEEGVLEGEDEMVRWVLEIARFSCLAMVVDSRAYLPYHCLHLILLCTSSSISVPYLPSQ